MEQVQGCNTHRIYMSRYTIYSVQRVSHVILTGESHNENETCVRDI